MNGGSDMGTFVPENEVRIFYDIQALLHDVLGVGRGKIWPTTSLLKELGIKSTDFPKIAFRLSEKFDIKVLNTDLFPTSIFLNPKLTCTGVFNQQGLDELKKWASFLDFLNFEKDPEVNKFYNLLNVQFLVDLVINRLQAQAPAYV